jgi:hypothetical protein
VRTDNDDPLSRAHVGVVLGWNDQSLGSSRMTNEDDNGYRAKM